MLVALTGLCIGSAEKGATDAPVDAVINADFRRIEHKLARSTGHGTAPGTGLRTSLRQLHRAAAVNVSKRPFPDLDKVMDYCQYSPDWNRVGGPSLSVHPGSPYVGEMPSQIGGFAAWIF